MSAPRIKSRTFFLKVVVRIVRAWDFFLRVIEYSLGNVRRDLEAGEAGAAGPAQVVQREFRNSELLHPFLTAGNTAGEQLRIYRSIARVICEHPRRMLSKPPQGFEFAHSPI